MDGAKPGTWSSSSARLLLEFLKDLLPCLLIGFLLGRRDPERSGWLAAPLVRYGVPLSVMGLLLKGGLSPRVVSAAILAAAVIGAVLLLARWIAPLRRALPGPCGQLGCCVGNTAYFGVPAALALLPASALPITIGYDLGATLLAWSVGPLLIAEESSDGPGLWSRLLKALRGSPAVPGLIGALLVQLTPWVDQVASALWWPSRVVIWLALVVVGMRLGSLSLKTNNTGVGFVLLVPSLLGKLVVFPAVLLLVGLILRLDPVMIQAITLQGTAPTAISVLLISEAVGRGQAEAAGLVLWSTLLALFSSPLWGYGLVLLFQGVE